MPLPQGCTEIWRRPVIGRGWIGIIFSPEQTGRRRSKELQDRAVVAYRAARLRCGKGYGEQLCAGAAGLLLPGGAAVLSVQDCADAPHRPAPLRRGKGYGP